MLPRLRLFMGLGRAKAPKGEKEDGAWGEVGLRGVTGPDDSFNPFLRCAMGRGIPEGFSLPAWTV
jgi:hypothetical protein